MSMDLARTSNPIDGLGGLRTRERPTRVSMERWARPPPAKGAIANRSDASPDSRENHSQRTPNLSYLLADAAAMAAASSSAVTLPSPSPSGLAGLRLILANSPASSEPSLFVS